MPCWKFPPRAPSLRKAGTLPCAVKSQRQSICRVLHMTNKYWQRASGTPWNFVPPLPPLEPPLPPRRHACVQPFFFCITSHAGDYLRSRRDRAHARNKTADPRAGDFFFTLRSRQSTCMQQNCRPNNGPALHASDFSYAVSRMAPAINIQCASCIFFLKKCTCGVLYQYPPLLQNIQLKTILCIMSMPVVIYSLRL